MCVDNRNRAPRAKGFFLFVQRFSPGDGGAPSPKSRLNIFSLSAPGLVLVLLLLCTHIEIQLLF